MKQKAPIVQALAELLFCTRANRLCTETVAAALLILSAHDALAIHDGRLYVRGVRMRLYDGRYGGDDQGRSWAYSTLAAAPHAVAVPVDRALWPAAPALDTTTHPIRAISRCKWSEEGTVRPPPMTALRRAALTAAIDALRRLSPEQAVALLPTTEDVHTFIRRGAWMGCDMSRGDVVRAIERSFGATLSHEAAVFEHRMVVYVGYEKTYVETDAKALHRHLLTFRLPSATRGRRPRRDRFALAA